MKSRSTCRSAAAAFVIAVVFAGCANTPPTQFYVLTSSAEPREANPGGPVIEVGPVTLPDYLERPQIVTTVSKNQLHLAEFHQWAEPLERNVARVIAENLSAELASERVVLYPARQSVQVDYQVVVNITRFDSSEDGATVLEAQWHVKNGAGERVAPQERSRIEGSAAELTYDAIAAEMSRVLGELCLKISALIEDGR